MKIKKTLSVEAMALEFLKAEWYKPFFNPVRASHGALVAQPDLNDPLQNQIRKDFLWQLRHPFLSRIPEAMKWYLGELEEDEFGELIMVRERSWFDTFGESKKLKDAAKVMSQNTIQTPTVDLPKIRAIKDAIGKHNFSEKIIVAAVNEQGPFTVIEGNHRAVAFQLKLEESGDRIHLPKEIIVGISPNMRLSPWLNS